MNAKDFIKAYYNGHVLVNDKLNGDIIGAASEDCLAQVHINAELIIFFKEIRDSGLSDIVTLVCDGYMTPLCTHNWRVKE